MEETGDVSPPSAFTPLRTLDVFAGCGGIYYLYNWVFCHGGGVDTLSWGRDICHGREIFFSIFLYTQMHTQWKEI